MAGRDDLVQADEDEEEESWWDEATSWAEEQVEGAVEWVEETGEGAVEWVEEAGEEVSEWWEEETGDWWEEEEEGDWWEGEDEEVDWVEEAVDWATGTAEEVLEEVWDTANDVADEIIEDMSDLADEVRDLVAGPLELLNDLVEEGFGDAADPVSVLDRVLEMLEGPPDAQERPVSGSAGELIGGYSGRGMACDLCFSAHPGQKTKPLKIDLDIGLLPSAQPGPIQGTRARPDPIESSGIWLASSVTQGGVSQITGFGREEPSFSVDLIYWRLDDDVVHVGARFRVDCRWEITDQNRTDITGPEDPNVEPDRWVTIYNDLKPQDPHGQPARAAYWSSPITQEHELFHASDDIGQAGRALEAEKNRLNQEDINTPWLWVSEEDAKRIQYIVRLHLAELKANVEQSVDEHYQSGGEARAYEAGRGSYQQLVDSIRARAARDGWPGEVEGAEESAQESEEGRE